MTDDATESPDDWASISPTSWVVTVAMLVVLVAATIWAFTEDRSPRRTLDGGTGPSGVYNPVTAGEPLPDGFRQLLPRDAIRPVYEPRFVAASGAGWPDDTDVIGVAQGAEAKAYPVSFLNGREMVIDEIDRQPIVVTW